MSIHLKKRLINASVIGLVFLLAACNEDQSNQKGSPSADKGPPAIAVTTRTIRKQEIPVMIKLPGRTVASLIAEVRPQVGGIILSQDFKEGSVVDKDTLLYKIDPATYEAALAQAEARLKSAEASQNRAKIKADRLRGLSRSNAVSKQEIDDVEALLLQADADVLSAEAAVKSAKINLDYTHVVAPIKGQIGRSNFTKGALVTTAQPKELVTIQQFDPMKVSISYPSSEFVNIKQRIKDGKVSLDSEHMDVTLILENGEEYEHKGRVTFADLTVEPSTGTIFIQAEFPNPDYFLLPGMFVTSVINQGIEKNGIAVPQQSVIRNQQGQPMVLLVTKKDNVDTVAPHPITISRAYGNVWVVDQGLSEGDRIVVEGFNSLERIQNRGIVAPTDEGEATEKQSVK